MNALSRILTHRIGPCKAGCQRQAGRCAQPIATCRPTSLSAPALDPSCVSRAGQHEGRAREVRRGAQVRVELEAAQGSAGGPGETTALIRSLRSRHSPPASVGRTRSLGTAAQTRWTWFLQEPNRALPQRAGRAVRGWRDKNAFLGYRRSLGIQCRLRRYVTWRLLGVLFRFHKI
jgi:hypothetical protein